MKSNIYKFSKIYNLYKNILKNYYANIKIL